MKLYTEIVSCKSCPNRCKMSEFIGLFNEAFRDRYLCINESPVKEILLHESLDAPDWCKLPDVPDEKNG